MTQNKPIYSNQMLISRKKMVRDVLYRTYGRKWALNPDDEDSWFHLQHCYQVSFNNEDLCFDRLGIAMFCKKKIIIGY